MKSYLDETSFRLIGKGWEIRHKLRAMSASASQGKAAGTAGGALSRKPQSTTVAAYLKSMPPRDTTRR